MKKNLLILSLVLAILLLSSCTSGGDDMKFKMIATVENTDDGLLVNVTEAEYAEGPYYIVYNEKTPVFSANGEKISVDKLSVGDVVEIYYNGQVMMSYPPKVVARKITVVG